ncbi:MAG: class I SAM-dependent methyltransferase [Phycisphaerae bacterium]
MSRRKHISGHYEPRINPERESFDILDWADPQSQRTRFRVLMENVDLHGKRLLDVGCGLADLLGYLQEHNVEVDYTGVDLLEPMAAVARRRQPEATIITGDIFGDNCLFEPGSFDVTFCSGTFNLNLGNNLEFLSVALRSLFRLAREKVVFNLLHHRVRYDDPKYYSFSPEHVLAVLAEMPCRATIIDDYLPNDFTVICDME